MATKYSGQILICLYRNHVVDLNKLLEVAKNISCDCVISPVSHQHFYRETENIESIQSNHSNFPRSDLQCLGSDWLQKVFMRLSDEVDCDSKDEFIRKHSERVILRELQWTNYLSNQGCIVLKLKFHESTNLARTLLSQLTYERRALVQLPLINPIEESHAFRQKASNDYESSWNYWNRFRLICDLHPSIGILLEITEKIPSDIEINRWLAEPVDMILISSKLFNSIGRYGIDLPEKHKKIIEKFILYLNVHVAIEATDETSMTYYVNYIQNMIVKQKTLPNKDMVGLFRNQRREIHVSLSEKNTSNVSKITACYKAAFERVLNDFDNTKICVMLFGSGILSLIEIFLNVCESLQNVPVLYVFEENQFKITEITEYIQPLKSISVKDIKIIKNKNDSQYHHEMHIIAALPFESTYLNQEMQNDFKKVEQFLRPNGIVIPEKTSLSIAPIMSQIIHNKIRTGSPLYIEDKTMDLLTYEKRVNHIFSVTPRNFQRISHETVAFIFNNNPNILSIEDDIAFMEFEIDFDCIFTGFIGYFSAKLFEDIELDTKKMDGNNYVLCPQANLYPIKSVKDMKCGQKLMTTFYRHLDTNSKKMWTEWSVEEPFIIPVHNLMGLYDSKSTI